MNKKIHKTILFLLILLSASLQSFASHKMGADMYYQFLGGTQYKIVARIYRDCRGIPFNAPSGSVGFGLNGDNACYIQSVSFNRTGIRDVSQICKDSASPCNPQNTAVNRDGVEEHTYELTIDISQAPYVNYVNSSTCGDVLFSIGQCCRNGNLTTITPNDFWVTMMINFRNLRTTGSIAKFSPRFKDYPIIYACCNQPLQISPGIIDSLGANDSIAFQMVHGINTLPNISVSYNSPFTSQYPMTPYCVPAGVNCTPNPSASPARGFYFNNKTGDIIFTPTNCTEVGILVVQVEKFKKDSVGKMVLVVRNRRDMELIIRDCGYNNAPKLSGTQTYVICEGEKLCFNVDGTDQTASPNQTIPDTVKMDWNNGIKGATFTVKNPTSREKTGEFCWQTKIGDASSQPYTFSVTVSDQHCPIPSINSKTFSITVQKCANFKKVHTISKAEVVPNPAKDFFEINPHLSQYNLEMYDNAGKLVLVQSNMQGNTMVKTENLKPGIYLVKCNNAEQTVYAKVWITKG